jgi:hypothetical protein
MGGPLDCELMDVMFPHSHLVRVQLAGTIVDAVFRVHVDEHDRRAHHGLGALNHPRLLRRLATMPPGVLLEDSVLHTETSLLPDGVVERAGQDGVGRLLAPPVELTAVVVVARGAAQTRHVRMTRGFGPYATRWVLTEDHRVDPSVLVAATVGEIGLVTRWPEPAIVVEPGPRSGRADPGQAWLLAEQIYEAWLSTCPQDPLYDAEPAPAEQMIQVL